MTMRSGKKFYILDEAYMMIRHAFNALLKLPGQLTSYIIFILTIPLRCQHYRFRRLTSEEISSKLAGVARRDGVKMDLLSSS